MIANLPDAYIAVINTASPSYNIMHDAARPYAVIRYNRRTGSVQDVLSRHANYRGATIKSGKIIRETKTR